MKKQNKTIAIFSGYFLPFLGGIERYTDKLSEHLKSLGYDIIIVTSNYDHLKQEEKGTYHIFRIPIYSLFHNRYPIPHRNKEYKIIMKKLEQEKIDAVICNTRFHLTSMIGSKFAKKKNIPVLVIEHGSNHFTVNNNLLDFFGEKYEHFITNRLKKYVTQFYGVSEKCNDWLQHFDIQASGIFYNSISRDSYETYKEKHFFKKKNDKIVITYAGRMIREKGVEALLEAFQKIKKKYKNTILVLAGDGPLLEDLQKKYIDNSIQFLGKLSYDEVMALYNDTDIFVHPSMFPEGLPTVILEAGIMECAVVATDRGGTCEVICDEKYGVIVKESIKGIQEGIESFLENPKRMESCKKAIHDRIMKNFTWDVTAKQVAKELEEMIDERNG